MANVLNRTTLQFLASVNTPDYPESDWIINPDLSAVQGQPEKYWAIDGDVVSLKDAAGRSAADVIDLPTVKKSKIVAIDTRTGTLVANGFIFAGLTFSLSTQAQTNLTNLMLLVQNPSLVSLVTFPIAWNTKDDLAVFSVPDAATLMSMYGTALSTVRGLVDAGTALKDAVRASTTPAEVAAVTDTR